MSDAAAADDAHREKNWASEGQEAVPTSSSSNVAQSEIPPPDSAGGDYRASSGGDGSGSKGDQPAFQKQPKPNKVYIGGLPENTRKEDLENCFGKIGTIVNIELKVGYGFVEFDNAEAAEESVAKYNEGFFMGNKIRVEISHGGGRAASYNREPGACFRCGHMGHWARECPSHPASHRREDAPLLIDRIDRGPRDYPPPRDPRYDYPPPPMSRDYRRPLSPLRDYRDYPVRRDYDDYRRGPSPDRYGGPPPDYRRYPDPYRGYGPPPAAPYPYDRYDRRHDPKYSYPAPPPMQRPRTPPRYRDEYDRAPAPRELVDYRGGSPRPPVRYPEYPRGMTPERTRRRSKSPPTRGGPPPVTFEYSPSNAPQPQPPVNGSFPDSYGAGGPPRSGRDYPNPSPRNGDIYRRA